VNTPIRWMIAIGVAMALSSGTLRANSVSTIVVDNSGRVFFSDYLRNRIWTIDPEGHRTILPAEIHTHHLALDAARIRRISPDGSVELLASSR
jgi:streptogramin lyase